MHTAVLLATFSGHNGALAARFAFERRFEVWPDAVFNSARVLTDASDTVNPAESFRRGLIEMHGEDLPADVASFLKNIEEKEARVSELKAAILGDPKAEQKAGDARVDNGGTDTDDDDDDHDDDEIAAAERKEPVESAAPANGDADNDAKDEEEMLCQICFCDVPKSETASVW